jgi:hypothetical protein
MITINRTIPLFMVLCLSLAEGPSLDPINSTRRIPQSSSSFTEPCRKDHKLAASRIFEESVFPIVSKGHEVYVFSSCSRTESTNKDTTGKYNIVVKIGNVSCSFGLAFSSSLPAAERTLVGDIERSELDSCNDKVKNLIFENPFSEYPSTELYNQEEVQEVKEEAATEESSACPQRSESAPTENKEMEESIYNLVKSSQDQPIITVFDENGIEYEESNHRLNGYEPLSQDDEEEADYQSEVYEPISQNDKVEEDNTSEDVVEELHEEVTHYYKLPLSEPVFYANYPICNDSIRNDIIVIFNKLALQKKLKMKRMSIQNIPTCEWYHDQISQYIAEFDLNGKNCSLRVKIEKNNEITIVNWTEVLENDCKHLLNPEFHNTLQQRLDSLGKE